MYVCIYTYISYLSVIFKVFISKESKTILVDGLQNFIVVDTPEKLMVLNGENEQRLKTYLVELEAKKITNG